MFTFRRTGKRSVDAALDAEGVEQMLALLSFALRDGRAEIALDPSAKLFSRKSADRIVVCIVSDEDDAALYVHDRCATLAISRDIAELGIQQLVSVQQCEFIESPEWCEVDASGIRGAADLYWSYENS